MTLQETHNLTQIEELCADYFNRLGKAITKGEKQEIRKKLKLLETHQKSLSHKHENGKKYPPRMKGLPDDVPMNKKEIYKLIDSTGPPYSTEGLGVLQNIDLSGVSVGSNEFKFVDKGWKEPKQMKPAHLFK